uniref:Golgi associated RAB2 interactor protein-like Rab2B-binding domain-containing protein n=1 Tax=Podarcis muralis TaxID=64176 RepID=A0A670JCJ7_PODMU
MSRGALARKHSAGEELGLEGGLLCQLVRSPDYNLFPNSAVFESNFIQVTKKGKWVDITNSPTIVTMGVTSSDPCLPLPNVLLMGRHRVPIRRSHSKALRRPPLELTRLLPLRYVRLSVHDEAQRILRVQTVTGKVYYLQLHQEHPHAVFALWSRLAEILQKGLSITTKDPNIRIRHSLVPSGSSPSSSSSGEYVDRATRGRSAMKKAGKKVTGALAHISKSPPKDKGKRKVSFQGDYNDELSALSNDIKGKCQGLPQVSAHKRPTPRSSYIQGCLLQFINGSTTEARSPASVNLRHLKSPLNRSRPYTSLRGLCWCTSFCLSFSAGSFCPPGFLPSCFPLKRIPQMPAPPSFVLWDQAPPPGSLHFRAPPHLNLARVRYP